MIRKRIMAVDYGDVRTGLAISDPMGILASGIGYISCGGMRNTAERVAKEADERDVGTIVIGLPKNMNGSEGERAAVVRAFAALLAPLTSAEIVFFDERLSTAAAHQLLNLTNTRGAKRKARVDTLSAQIILQNYLDSPACQKQSE
ncbi:MAG: Holliday junction resolvase RuvX [Clostridiales bacterium]|nr:Holliday junction resolvase RuvX [Clostridiales bacterium]